MARPRITAAARVQRLLAMLQWAATHAEGVPVAELCERFGLRPDDLVKELELAMMVGADSLHYDDMPFEVFVEDGLVFVRLFAFRQALRLTPAEGLALVAAADVLVDHPAADDGHDGDGDRPGPLPRALAKLADLLGIEPGQNVDVDLDPDGGPTGRLLRGAIHAGHQVSFTYWTYARDAVTERVVDPWLLFAQGGAWYLVGRAHDADAERRFRLDRMVDVVERDQPRVAAPPRGLSAGDVAVQGPQVVLDLAPAARWVAEAHPVLATELRDDGQLRVTLAVAGSSWLERLLLRLGPEATVVSIDPELGDDAIVTAAAARVLARYRAGAEGAAR